MPAAQSPFRIAPVLTKTSPYAHLTSLLAPARATCTAPCPSLRLFEWAELSGQPHSHFIVWQSFGISSGRQLRQTEIENLGFAPIGDEDIRRLDVTMDDSLRMRCSQARHNLTGKIRQFFGRKRGR